MQGLEQIQSSLAHENKFIFLLNGCSLAPNYKLHAKLKFATDFNLIVITWNLSLGKFFVKTNLQIHTNVINLSRFRESYIFCA